MVRVLNVAEKPSVAKEVSRILSGGNPRRTNGPARYNCLWEFPFSLRGQQVNMVFTSVSGHLQSIDFSEEYSGNWESTDPEMLFTAPIHKFVPEDRKEIEQNLINQSRDINWLVLWLDCDREGENIAYEVIDVVRRAAPANLQVFRARFSALIPAALHQACANLVPPNIHFSEAVDARQEIDLRIGSAFTRFQTIQLGKKYADMPKVISYGPCQFPTLGFVVERHLQIESFVPRAFWSIEMMYSCVDHDGTVVRAQFNWCRGRLFDRVVCLGLFEMCSEAERARVVKIDRRATSKWKPAPLSTVEFQKAASRKMRLSSERAMQVAEDLYRRGLISYPRTETDSFQEGTDLRSFITMQTGCARVGAFATMLLNGGFAWPRNGGHNDNAHPPIHPTQYIALNALANNDERSVYEFVVRRFLAACSKDARGDQTIVTVKMAQEMFTCKGLIVRERNYLEVYSPYERWTGNMLPQFQVEAEFVPSLLEFRSSETRPPPYLTEADLISLMDRNGIGTDATIAEHISTIQKRAYAEKRDRFFHPTRLGIALVQGYEAIGSNDLWRPRLRAAMEQGMKDVAEGRIPKNDLVERTLRDMLEVFRRLKAGVPLLDQSVASIFRVRDLSSEGSLQSSSFSTCGDCRSQMDVRIDGVYPRFLACRSCRSALRLPKNGDLSAHPHECPICHFQVIQVKNPQRGTSYKCCPKCFNDVPELDRPHDPSKPFFCFTCSFGACSLSSPLPLPVRACSECLKDGLCLRRSSSSSLYLACSSSSEHRGRSSCSLPSSDLFESIEALPTRFCTRCCLGDRQTRTHLVSIRFGRGLSVPVDFTNRHLEAVCLGCNPEILELFDRFAGPDGFGRVQRVNQAARQPRPQPPPPPQARMSAPQLNSSFQQFSGRLSSFQDAAPAPANAAGPRSMAERYGSAAQHLPCMNCGSLNHQSHECIPQQRPPPQQRASYGRYNSSSGSGRVRGARGGARGARGKGARKRGAREGSRGRAGKRRVRATGSSAPSSNSNVCYNCNREGHWASECPDR